MDSESVVVVDDDDDDHRQKSQPPLLTNTQEKEEESPILGGGGGGGGGPILRRKRTIRMAAATNSIYPGGVTVITTVCGLQSPSNSRAPLPSVGLSVTKLVIRLLAPQTNPNVQLEGDEEIDEEEAICKQCFSIFRKENIVKIKCGCISALPLSHEACVVDICDKCGQENQKTPVTLLRVTVPTAAVSGEKKKNRCWFPCCWFPCFR